MDYYSFFATLGFTANIIGSITIFEEEGKVSKKINFKILLMFATGILSAFLITPSWAEEPQGKDYREYTLGEIVVVGQAAAVRDISIIDALTPVEFEAVSAESVADVLTYVPGIQVTYGRKYFPTITIHGLDQNRILTLIDGVPYYETKYGGLDMNQVSLEAVARIDVVKGAPSVLYGPNALGGVINIITKKPGENPFFSASARYGVDGLDGAFVASASHGRKMGIFNYWLSYAHREWDSWDLSDDFEPREGQIRAYPPVGRPVTRYTVIQDKGERVNSDYKTDNFWGKFGIESSEDTEVYVNFHYIKTEKGAPPDLDRVNVFSDFSQFARITAYDDWGIDLSGEHGFSDGFNLQGKLYYHNHEDEYTSYDDETFSNAFALSTYKDYILGGMILGDYKIVDWDTLRFSFHYKGDSHEQRDLDTLPYAESFAYTGSLGLENEMYLLDEKLSVVAGISYDWFDVTKAQSDPATDGNIVDSGTPGKKDEFNPLIGAVYQVNDAVKLFASVARKTRFPTLSQIYSGEDPVTGADSPNLDLKAEKATNYTVGISGGYKDLFSVEVTPFFHDISDYITRDVPPSENPYEQYKNYEKVKMFGVEVNAEIMPYKDLLFRIGYAYIDASDESSGRVSDKVREVPEYTLNLGLQYTIPKINTKLNWTMLFMGESYYQIPTPGYPTDPEIKNESYKLSNVRITQPFMSNHLDAFFSADNLFDEDYEPNTGQPAPGRKIWIGLTYKY